MLLVVGNLAADGVVETQIESQLQKRKVGLVEMLFGLFTLASQSSLG